MELSSLTFHPHTIIPSYLLTKIDNTLSYPANIRIDTQLQWAEWNSYTIQTILNSYIEHEDTTVYVFLIGDISTPFCIPSNVRLYRTSLLKSQQNVNEYILPYVWEGKEIAFEPLEKTEKPIIGFCGKNSRYREQTLQCFTQDNQFETNYIFRESFMNGHTHDEHFAIKNNMHLSFVQDFFLNIEQSHFTICNRGEGNFAIRFYQTLSCGRIPILIDSDIRLPFDDEIKWDEIIVMATTEELLKEKVSEYWRTKNIIEMQNKCRNIYDIYFANTQFFTKILL